MKEITFATIGEIEDKIKGKPRPVQIEILKQEKISFMLLAATPPGTQAKRVDHAFPNLVDQLLDSIITNDDFKYDCDWNWFFNAKNFPNQDLVFATKDFLELKRKDEVNSLFMMNVLLKQMDDIEVYVDKPIDYISKINGLPLSKVQQHILYGLLLRWHGGCPINYPDQQYNTFLRLVEREFLQMFPEEKTPEKEFSALDPRTLLHLSTIKSQVNPPQRKTFSFPESKYLEKVSIDFEDLPQYVIRKGIIWRFEDEFFKGDSDYQKWVENYEIYLNSIPATMVAKTLRKGIEYGGKAFQWHIDNECSNDGNCIQNESWERRISVARRLLLAIEKESPDSNDWSRSNKKDYSLSTVPIIELSGPEREWLEEVYERTKKGDVFSYKDIWSKLHLALPSNFHPASIDARVISSNGEDIKLLGVIAVEKNLDILQKVDTIIYVIRGMLLKNSTKREVQISEIARECKLEEADICFCLQLIREFGDFYSGTKLDSTGISLMSIDVGGNDAIYYSYIHFNGIESLINAKSFQNTYKPMDNFTFDEVKLWSQKLDDVLAEVQLLKVGQEVIWTDVLNELNELKSLFSIGKKNWKQLLAGKLLEMTAGGIISETISKEIITELGPFMNNLLN